MFHLLRAREFGDDAVGLDDAILDRWTRLQPDASRDISVPFADSRPPALSLDTPNGHLILVCGTLSNNSGALSLYRRPPPKSRPDTHPLVTTPEGALPDTALTCAQWFPNDNALFVTGASNRTVSVWDTETFSIVANISIGQQPDPSQQVLNLAFSSHPAANSSLAAAACSQLSHATLVDLSSGAATHMLSPDVANSAIHDVCWSPTMPFHIATIDTTGQTCIFDIRRSGAMSCLLQMSPLSMPLPHLISRSHTEVPLPSRPIRMRKKRPRTSESMGGRINKLNSMSSTRPLLGLGCGWRTVGDARHCSLRSRSGRRASSNGAGDGVEQEGAERLSESVLSWVEYTPDGATVVSRRKGKGFMTYDVLTGCLAGTFGESCNGADKDRHVCFRVARDGRHVIGAYGSYIAGLFAKDLDTGGLVHCSEGCRGPMGMLELHGVEEELYVGCIGGIRCFSGMGGEERNEIDKESEGARERGLL